MSRSKRPRNRKRPKNWHRGQREDWLHLHTQLPDVGSGADPTTGAPIPMPGPGSSRHRGLRGDAL